MVNVAHHADDSAPGRVRTRAQVQALANGITIGPEVLGHRLVHHDDLGSLCSIRVGQLPALLERNAHRLEVVGTDHLPVSLGSLFWIERGVPLDSDAPVTASGRERETGHGSYRVD